MERLQLKDFYGYTFLSGLSFAPDGAHALLVAKKADEAGTGYKSDLWLFTAADKSFRLLSGAGDIAMPLWLDNGNILFSAMRDKALGEKVAAGETWTVFYKLALDGGEAAEYFRLPNIITGARLVEGERFALSVRVQMGRPDIEHMTGEEKTKALAAQKAEKDYEVLDEMPFWFNGAGFTNGKRTELHLYDKATGEDKAICPAPLSAGVKDIVDGKILYTTSAYVKGLGDMMKAGLCLYDTATGENRDIVPLEAGWSISGARFLGENIVAAMTKGEEYGINESPRMYHVGKGEPAPWTEPIAFGSSVGSDCTLGGTESQRVRDGKLYYVTTDGYNSGLHCLAQDGTVTALPVAGGAISGFDFGPDGIYFIGLRGTGLQEVYLLTDKGEEKLSDFNGPFLADKTLSAPEHFTYENDGVLLDGFVMKPVGYEAGKKYPAILDIHGGPRTVYGDVFFHEMQVWANEGYFVFFCNPRGGDGRGDAFADIRGRYGKEDYSDIMRFTDVVLEKYPDIDDKRVGVTGGSYGGFMTNWIIGHTNRFAAAATQRSISNWVSMAYISDIHYGFSEDQTAGTPWDGLDKMWEQSPLKYAPNVTTPTLFIHSREDFRCPLPEGLQLFTALKRFGVDARLCMFRGENHELSRGGKPIHRARRLEEITNWFEKYLKA